MAVLGCSICSNKENVPPPLMPPHGVVAVKSRRMKRPGCVKARMRAPLRDITNLFLAPRPPSAVGSSAAVPSRSREEPALPAATRSGAPDGVAVKARYSLRKDFR